MTIRNVDADRMVRLGDVLDTVETVLDDWYFSEASMTVEDLPELMSDITSAVMEVVP